MKLSELHPSDVNVALTISLFVSYVFAIILLLVSPQLSGWETVGVMLIGMAWPVILAIMILKWNIH
jgi:hypothetical protein